MESMPWFTTLPCMQVKMSQACGCTKGRGCRCVCVRREVERHKDGVFHMRSLMRRT